MTIPTAVVSEQDEALLVKDSYRLCYVRGPEGINIELAERIG
jgi:hypothetical protein